jgi:hypothetical protein
MSRWFRFYDGALDDPKVQSLPGDLFKMWVNLLCIASKHDGKLPVADLPFMLRTDERKVTAAVKELTARGLLDGSEGGPEPHNWSGRQHKSDVSNERVKRHRERNRNGECNVTSAATETPPDTDTDTEQKKGSEPNGSGARAPSAEIIPMVVDARKALFDEALPLLAKYTGKSVPTLRSLVAKWLKETGDDALRVSTAIARSIAEQRADPISWIERGMKPADPDAAIYRGVL